MRKYFAQKSGVDPVAMDRALGAANQKLRAIMAEIKADPEKKYWRGFLPIFAAGVLMLAAPAWAEEDSGPMSSPPIVSGQTPEMQTVGALSSCAALEYAFETAANEANPPMPDHAKFSHNMGQVFAMSAEYYARQFAPDAHAYVVEQIGKVKADLDDLLRSDDEDTIKARLHGCSGMKDKVDAAMDALKAEQPGPGSARSKTDTQ
jgi:hypothetical protein